MLRGGTIEKAFDNFICFIILTFLTLGMGKKYQPTFFETEYLETNILDLRLTKNTTHTHKHR